MCSVKTGLYNVVDKENYKTLMFIRNPIVADGAEIGFLPGDKSEKIADFCRPFLQYVENSKDQFYADTLIRTEKIKMDVVSFLKGVSIDDSFVIMDEAEDLNTKLIKLVGSRIGKTSCIVFTGDWSQSENKYKTENGLVKLIQETKGNSLVGTVVLDEDVRSDASKIFAKL
jgi:PhoH-like ATPase